jgi:ATP-dependent RNA helicase DeaD
VSILTFDELNLAPPLLTALKKLGFTQPTVIQQQGIPHLLNGENLLGQGQTGTGKTAAFALPILSRLKLNVRAPQALVLAPTREIAIQVAQAFTTYAQDMPGVQVTPIYGGQEYRTQLRALKQGTHIVVGTPGRVIDHLKRGTLKLDQISTLIIDEADEMLKMGFIDPIEWILQEIKHPHQTALFSATMPLPMQKMAKKYLSNAKKIIISQNLLPAETIKQFYVSVPRKEKLAALIQMLEFEDIVAAIIFVQTKYATTILSEQLQAHGHKVAALNGDIQQSLRETIVQRLKKGSLDIIVATDVAARGIDIDRISHVINYDKPDDVESYIHRIGRTGRAGRSGKALLFVAPPEQRFVRTIENLTKHKVQQYALPTQQALEKLRQQNLVEKITTVLAEKSKLNLAKEIVDNVLSSSEISPYDLATALIHMQQKPKRTLSLKAVPMKSDERQTLRRRKDGPPRRRDDSFHGKPKRRVNKRFKKQA